MPDSPKHTWIAPVSAVLGLLLSAACAWWQIRRDRHEFKKTGTLRHPKDAWLDTAIMIAACVLPVGALVQLKSSHVGGPRPLVALLLAATALVCQAYMVRRVQGRVEVGVGLGAGAMMSI